MDNSDQNFSKKKNQNIGFILFRGGGVKMSIGQGLVGSTVLN